MTENSKTTDTVTLLDQLGVTLENCAVIFAAYYKKLLDGGIPVDLAATMTRDAQNIFWGRAVPK